MSLDPNYQNYHRVLNRAIWSSRKASSILLRHLSAVFAPSGPLVMGIDDTIERRWENALRLEASIVTPCVPCDQHFVKASGLRWRSFDAFGGDSLGKRGLGHCPSRAVLAPSIALSP